MIGSRSHTISHCSIQMLSQYNNDEGLGGSLHFMGCIYSVPSFYVLILV